MLSDRGFTLIEVLVAVVLLAVGVASYMGLLSQKLDLLGRVKDKLQVQVTALQLMDLAVLVAREPTEADAPFVRGFRVQELDLGPGPLVLKEICSEKGELCVRVAVARKQEASR